MLAAEGISQQLCLGPSTKSTCDNQLLSFGIGSIFGICALRFFWELRFTSNCAYTFVLILEV